MNTFKRFSGAVGSFVNAFLPEYKNESKGIYLYGKDNLLPNNLLKFIADSGVATRCVGKLSEYIASDGFTDEASALIRVNQFQTADELLQEQSQYASSLNAVAFHVSRKGGKVYSVKALPVQCIRKKIGGGFIYNESYGQPKFDTKLDKYYPEYYGVELPNSLLSNGKYAAGEILYLYRKTPFNMHYAVPDYYAQIEDIRSSAELSKFDLETIVNGFVTSAMITMVGDVDSVNKDNEGKTELDYVIEDFQKFTGQIKDDVGLSGRNKAWLNFSKTKEEAPVVQQFDTKAILDSSNAKRDVIERAVCRLFGIHPVLMGYSDAAVLGNTQAIANASVELNKVVNPYQRMITQGFKMLYPNNEWGISEYMPITYIEPSLYDKMTEDEIRNKLLGLPPKETDAVGEGDKIIKAINSLSPLVANKVLESLDETEIRALIGLGARITQPTNNVPTNL